MNFLKKTKSFYSWFSFSNFLASTVKKTICEIVLFIGGIGSMPWYSYIGFVVASIGALGLAHDFYQRYKPGYTLIEAATKIYPILKKLAINIEDAESLKAEDSFEEVLWRARNPKKREQRLELDRNIEDSINFLGNFIKNGALPLYGKSANGKEYEQIPTEKMRYWSQDYTKLYTKEHHEMQPSNYKSDYIYMQSIICKRKDLKKISKQFLTE